MWLGVDDTLKNSVYFTESIFVKWIVDGNDFCYRV